MRPLAFSVPSSAFVFLTVLTAASPAFAAWGENWGEMVWGLSVSVPSVPAVGLFVLAFGLLTTAAWRLRARKALHSALAILVVPMLAGVLSSPAHAQVTVPNTFADGTPALASEVNANFNALESAVNGIDCATAAEVVCNYPDVTCPACPSLVCPECGSSDFFNQGFNTGVASVDITTDNAAAEAAAAAAAGSTACTQAGGTWNAGASTCAPAYNCYVGGFCAAAALALSGYTNAYDGDTPSTEPALGAGCNTYPGSQYWSNGDYLYSFGSETIWCGEICSSLTMCE